ncbi:tetratricopeptide repeat protein [Pelagicoccus enzymogenes]|uniref:tetratricopeptide repeat protein n=1 Tax=Pelagicoccus enzymogenes TaxID=2773457 RepID=UPI0028105649|nr:tetratricopeptide repeat protein [Pelagicoccus enzymogenes]MDQ8200627.1 tetratricopeptide repeat protein [Pelagicoccus enzymogenes]
MLIAIGCALLASAIVFRFSYLDAPPGTSAKQGVPGVPEISSMRHLPSSFDRRLSELYETARRDQESHQAKREIAYLYHANGYLSEACQIYDLVMGDPTSTMDQQFAYRAAVAHLDFGSQDQALTILNQLSSTSDYAPVFLKLGDAFLKREEIELAKDAYLECLRLNPALGHAALGLARCHMREKRWSSALEALDRSQLSFSTIHSLRAEIYRELDEIEKMEDAQHRVYLEKEFSEPSDPWMATLYLDYCYDSYQLLVASEIARESGRAGLAAQYIDRAKTVAPENPKVLIESGSLLYAAGDLGDALKAFRTATDQAEAPPAAFVGLSKVLAASDDFKSSLGALQRGLETHPRSPEIHNALGELYLTEKEHGKALKAFEQAFAINPNDLASVRNLGTLRLAKGDQQGLDLLRDYLLRQPDDTDVALFVAHHLIESRGEPAAAITLLEKSYQSHRDPPQRLGNFYASALQNLANDQVRNRQFEAAIGSLERSLEIWPQNAQAMANLGMIHAQLGNKSKALPLLKGFINLRPDDAIGWLNLGKAYLISDRIDEAVAAWETGIALPRTTSNSSTFSELEMLVRRFKQ